MEKELISVMREREGCKKRNKRKDRDNMHSRKDWIPNQ